MIQPYLQDDAFLDDIARARGEPGRLHLWWLGQSGFLVQAHQHYLLLDPYLSDSLTEKYANTDMPHVRMTARVVDPTRLDFIDVVTSSHSHTDHLDAATLRPLRHVNPALAMVIPAANSWDCGRTLAVSTRVAASRRRWPDCDGRWGAGYRRPGRT